MSSIIPCHSDDFDLVEFVNFNYVKLFYCEFQKYEVMTMSVVGGPPEKHANPSYKATKRNEGTFLISDYY